MGSDAAASQQQLPESSVARHLVFTLDKSGDPPGAEPAVCVLERTHRGAGEAQLTLQDRAPAGHVHGWCASR